MDYCIILALVVALLFVQGHVGESVYGEDCSRFMCEYRISETLTNLQNENARLAERIKKLEQHEEKQSAVSAHVRLSATTPPLSDSERVMYDIVITNKGDAYDAQKAQFSAPVPGIYLVHLSGCLTGGHWMNLEIVKDGEVIGKVRSGDSTIGSCAADAISVHLEADDNIWVQRETGSSTGLYEGGGWNSFTATLIYAD